MICPKCGEEIKDEHQHNAGKARQAQIKATRTPAQRSAEMSRIRKIGLEKKNQNDSKGDR